jgi:hypothetical protein
MCAGAAVGTFCLAPCRVNFEGTGYNVRCIAADTWDDPTGSCTREWSAATCYISYEFQTFKLKSISIYNTQITLSNVPQAALQPRYALGQTCRVTTDGDMALFGDRAVVACIAVRPALSNI